MIAKKRANARKTPEIVGFRGFEAMTSFWLHNMVAGVGFEPHDLRVMSPTSYQAALPRDILYHMQHN